MKYKGEDIIVEFTKYYDGNLAMCMYDESYSPYATVTVNIPDEEKTDGYCAFIDTNNCGDSIINWLDKNNFGQATGKVGFSGFCIYPEYKFNKEIIEEYSQKEIF